MRYYPSVPPGHYRPMRALPARRLFGSWRLSAAIALAVWALLPYQCSSEYNPVTGEQQHITLTPQQEIALGVQSAPQMAQQFGGLHPDATAQALVKRVGREVVAGSDAGKTEWQFDFPLLADPRTVNAFALPGGQTFITAALLSRLETDGQLAGVLGDEVGHVVARHSAQRIAKQQLTEGITGAMLVGSGSIGGARLS